MVCLSNNGKPTVWLCVLTGLSLGQTHPLVMSVEELCQESNAFALSFKSKGLI